MERYFTWTWFVFRRLPSLGCSLRESAELKRGFVWLLERKRSSVVAGMKTEQCGYWNEEGKTWLLDRPQGRTDSLCYWLNFFLK
jgi:hypothetical protein